MPDVVVWKIIESQPWIKTVCLEMSPDSLNAASHLLPGGVYTTLRTYGRKRILPLGDHIARLEESARLAGQPVQLDGKLIREALGEALRRFAGGEARIRITVDLEQCPGETTLVLEPLTTPSQAEYKQGVLAVTVPMHRENPRSKQIGFIETAEAVRRELPEGANEALMVDEDGRILEGLSSNFFAVKEGIVFTAEEGVLPGITRSLVLEAIQQLGLEVRLESVSLAELPNLDEAFLTSSSRSVLPVRQIDDCVIGTGRPGPITKRSMEAYREEIELRIEEVMREA